MLNPIYIILFGVLVVLELLYFRIAKRYRIIDKPNDRSSHSSVTLRGGGIIFLLGAFVYSLCFSFQYPWFLVGLTAIAGVSFIDDVCGVPNKFRLIVHFVAMFLMFEQFGILNFESWWMIIVALTVCVGIINAYNFMDGINGITGGYSLAVLVPLLYINQEISYIDNDFLIVVVISVLVFNLFNFKKCAKCFAGDVGAIGIAFIILFALGLLVLKTGDFTYILLLAVYGVDSTLTIVHRIMLKEKLGEAHRKHVYQLMANELNIPHVIVSAIYVIAQLLVSFGLLLLPINNWLYLTITIVLLSLIYLIFKKKYYWMHKEYLKTK